MYSKKYRLEKIEEFNGHNYIYDDMVGSICHPAYFKVGERGWFLCKTDDYYFDRAHRIHTSTVQNVEYIDDTIVLETLNTRFSFRLIKDKGELKCHMNA